MWVGSIVSSIVNAPLWVQKRMAAEQLRALVEGAPFIVHTASGASLQHLWLQCVCSAFCIPQPALDIAITTTPLIVWVRS